MTPDKVVVTLIGLGLITFIIWYFWLVKHPGVKAKVGTGGYQEALILVKGGYTPDIIIVDHGKPVRLNFLRTESAASIFCVRSRRLVLIPSCSRTSTKAASYQRARQSLSS